MALTITPIERASGPATRLIRLTGDMTGGAGVAGKTRFAPGSVAALEDDVAVPKNAKGLVAVLYISAATGTTETLGLGLEVQIAGQWWVALSTDDVPASEGETLHFSHLKPPISSQAATASLVKAPTVPAAAFLSAPMPEMAIIDRARLVYYANANLTGDFTSVAELWVIP